MELCRKRVLEEIIVLINEIFEEEISGLYGKGYDFIANIPKCEKVEFEVPVTCVSVTV